MRVSGVCGFETIRVCVASDSEANTVSTYRLLSRRTPISPPSFVFLPNDRSYTMPRQKALAVGSCTNPRPYLLTLFNQLNSILTPIGSLGLQHQVMDAGVVEDLLTTNEAVDPLEFFPQYPHSLVAPFICQVPCEADFQKILDALARNGVYSDKKWRFNQVNTVGGCLVDNPSDEQRTAALFNEVSDGWSPGTLS